MKTEFGIRDLKIVITYFLVTSHVLNSKR